MGVFFGCRFLVFVAGGGALLLLELVSAVEASALLLLMGASCATVCFRCRRFSSFWSRRSFLVLESTAPKILLKPAIFKIIGLALSNMGEVLSQVFCKVEDGVDGQRTMNECFDDCRASEGLRVLSFCLH